jgi:hypothetical protein
MGRQGRGNGGGSRQARAKASAAARAAQSVMLPANAAEHAGTVDAPMEVASKPEVAAALNVSLKSGSTVGSLEAQESPGSSLEAQDAAEQDITVHAKCAAGCQGPAEEKAEEEEEDGVGTLHDSHVLTTKSGATVGLLRDTALAELSSMIKEILQKAALLAVDAAAAATWEAAEHAAQAAPSLDGDTWTSCPAALSPDPHCDTLPTATRAEEGTSDESRAPEEGENEDESEAPAVEVEACVDAQAQAEEAEGGEEGEEEAGGEGEEEEERGAQLDSFELSISEMGGERNEMSILSEGGELSISEEGGYEGGYDGAEFESGSGEEGAVSDQVRTPHFLVSEVALYKG